MLIHLKETQEHMETAHKEIPEERMKEQGEEITEEQFLKDLYLYMKKRDTPIERIPHLGFKQIDLFVMFKTVRDLGGYHQVTAQQLWKQVYNTLGGNPRSTSAATCTRRHYEKLLLPYECHIKGIMMNALPQNQPKHFHYFSRDNDDDGPTSAKHRKLIPIPLPQSLYNPKADPHGKGFPVPLHYPHYYAPSHAVLPPYVPMPPSVLASHSPPAPKPQFAINAFNTHPQPNPASSDSAKGPLEHLRGLADKYKNLAGLAEPLNLSVKASSQEANKNPVSSFSPPSSKFLNKPFSLYNPHQLQVVKGGETQDDEAAVEGSPHSSPEEEKDAYIVDVKPAPRSPAYSCGPTLRIERDNVAMTQKNGFPKADFQSGWPKEERDGGLELKRFNLSHILPSLPRENGGKMEIEIPLSVLHKWLRMCQVEQSSMLPTKEEQTRQRSLSEPDVLTTNTPPQMNPQHQSPAAEDLRLRRGNVPSPLTIAKAPHHSNTSPNHFSSYKPLSAGGVLQTASSRNVYPVEQQDTGKSFHPKPPSFWSPYNIETKTLKTSPGPITGHQDYPVTKHYREDTSKSGKERSEMGSSTVLMLNSSPSSVLHLTTEEVMKLKKIISSSS